MSVDFDELALVDLSRHFGRRRVLTHVSFTCRAGEIVGLLGPNGAGKSTLLSIVSTLVSPSAGEVRYGGRTASKIGSGLRARLGLLSHDLHLYPELTARENLTFFGELYALNDVPSRVDRAVAWLMWVNPLTYGVAGLRWLVYWDQPAAVMPAALPAWPICLVVTVLFATVCLVGAFPGGREAARRAAGRLQVHGRRLRSQRL